MKAIDLKIKKLHKSAIIPAYQSAEAAGFDLHSVESCVIESGKSALIATGLAFEIPKGYEVQIRPRSGLALKHGISVLNTPGTIDSDYRGEIKVILINHSNAPFSINIGDRIAQGVVNEIICAKIIEVEDLANSTRGAMGFGSSGV